MLKNDDCNFTQLRRSGQLGACRSQVGEADELAARDGAGKDRQELEERPNIGFLVKRRDDYCATSYWYLDRPEGVLPPLAPLAQRVADLNW